MSGICGKLAVGRSLGKLTPKQLGDEDEIDEDVKTEMDRVAAGGADNDVVKVMTCRILQTFYEKGGTFRVTIRRTFLRTFLNTEESF